MLTTTTTLTTTTIFLFYFFTITLTINAFRHNRFKSNFHQFKHLNDGKTFLNKEEYLSFLDSKSQLPEGFSVGFTRFEFKPFEINKILPMNLTIIYLTQPTTSFSAVFTNNLFPGGPILVGKDRMKESKYLQAIVVNNKISNVCPGGIEDRGYSDSEKVCQEVANALNLPSSTYVFPSSTGIIGWRLPVEAIKTYIPKVITTFQSNSILPAALGICTTDRYPKLRSFEMPDKSWSIVGIAKGAGMIGFFIFILFFYYCFF
jgi:glutamate N-acetyltransferase/amino-acid N-acetyltransferase